MQAVPTLSKEQVLEVFEATCRRLDPELPCPNNLWGYGEIDAEAGLEYLLAHADGIVSPKESSSPFSWNEIVNSKSSNSKCFNLSGQALDAKWQNGKLPCGIYIISDGEGRYRKIVGRPTPAHP